MPLDGEQIVVTGVRTMVRGATWDPVLVFKDKLTNTPINLSGWIGAGKGVRLNLRIAASDPTPTLTPTCTILDSGTTGRVQLLVHANLTTALAAGISLLKGDPEFFDSSSGTEIVRKPCRFEVPVFEEYTK